MKKGDLRRETILNTAAELFYRKGYEGTSIQDILDELGMSKGGFYHHFESKLQLLEALCNMRMAENVRRMQERVERAAGDPVAQLNRLYEGCVFWQADQLDFAAMLLRTAYLGGSVQLKESLKQSVLTGARPVIREIIHAGIEKKVFFTRFPDDIGELLLLLFANLNDEISMRLAMAENAAECTSGILSLMQTYRHAAETLTGAPYGSLALYDFAGFPALAEKLIQRR